MRTTIPSRFITQDYTSDIQKIINEQPTTCVITRPKNRSTAGQQQSFSQAASFECRIDPYKPRITATETVSEAGESIQTTYLLLARYDYDQFGNLVDLRHSDLATVDGIQYRVVNILKLLYGAKTEAYLVLEE